MKNKKVAFLTVSSQTTAPSPSRRRPPRALWRAWVSVALRTWPAQAPRAPGRVKSSVACSLTGPAASPGGLGPAHASSAPRGCGSEFGSGEGHGHVSTGHGGGGGKPSRGGQTPRQSPGHPPRVWAATKPGRKAAGCDPALLIASVFLRIIAGFPGQQGLQGHAARPAESRGVLAGNRAPPNPPAGAELGGAR